MNYFLHLIEGGAGSLAAYLAAHVLLCLLFGIGLLMVMLFWQADASHDAQTDTLFAEEASAGPAATGLLLIAATAWKGMENIIEGPNRWTCITLGLTATTLPRCD